MITGALLCLAALAPAAAQDVQQTQTIRINGSDSGPISFLPPGREPKKGTGGLKGRVLASDSGSALRRAQVRVSGPDIGTKTTLTDAQGRYEFKELPAGRFTLSVIKSGFVTMQYGQNRPFEPGRPIELAEAQVMDKVDVALPRGSVLAGRVVDEFGEAVAEADVTAMRMQYQNGRRRLVPSGRNASTNDLGQFRIYGLPPGEYYVSATLRNMSTMMLDMIGGPNAAASPAQSAGYAATYYPSTPNPGEAQRVVVAVGQELSSVDIQLQPVKLARVSGIAMGSDGKPMTGAIVMLLPSTKDALMFGPGNTARTDKDGNFTVNDVTPGDYSLQVQSTGGVFQTAAGGNVMAFAFAASSDGTTTNPASGPIQREFAMTTLSVTGDGVTGLVLTGSRGAKATGTIRFENGQKPDDVTSMRVSSPSTDADGSPMPSLGFGQVKDGGTFEIDSLVGGHTFRVGNAPRGWVLKRVTVNGEDVTDRGMDFKAGEDVNGIEIEMTNKVTSIAGTASGANGSVKDYTVVVFPTDEQKWILPQNRWTASTRPNQDGQFKLSNLPPGDYYAAAVEYVAQGEWQDPEWLAHAAKSATKFTLEEGASKTLDLKLSGS